MKLNSYSWLLAVTFLAGCASPSSKMNNVTVGMTKQEVVSIMGKPGTTSATGSVEYLQYRPDAMARFAGQQTWYYVRLVDGKVDSYGLLGDFDSTKHPTVNVNVQNK